MGGGATWANLFEERNGTGCRQLYEMVTGTRLATATYCPQLTFFTIAGETTTVDLVMRESKDDIQVSVISTRNLLIKPIDSDELKSILATTGRGLHCKAYWVPDKNLRTMPCVIMGGIGCEFDEWGRGIVLLFPTRSSTSSRLQEFPRITGYHYLRY